MLTYFMNVKMEIIKMIEENPKAFWVHLSILKPKHTTQHKLITLHSVFSVNYIHKIKYISNISLLSPSLTI